MISFVWDNIQEHAQVQVDKKNEPFVVITIGNKEIMKDIAEQVQAELKNKVVENMNLESMETTFTDGSKVETLILQNMEGKEYKHFVFTCKESIALESFIEILKSKSYYNREADQYELNDLLEVQLGREIIATLETNPSHSWHFSFRSESEEVVEYKDDFIHVVAAKDTRAMLIEIFNPLTSASSNPIIYVKDNGDCIRAHGERGYFRLYAEVLLRKQPTLFKAEYMQEKQNEIIHLAKEELKKRA